MWKLAIISILAFIACGVSADVAKSVLQQETPAYYLGVWEWVVDPEQGEFWQVKNSGSVAGVFDLRTFADKSTAGRRSGEVRCCALVRSLKQITDPEFIRLGNERNSPVDLNAHSIILTKYGLVDGATVREFVKNLLTEKSDATGRDRWRPIVPNRNGNIELYLGSNEPVFSVSENLLSDRARASIQTSFQNDYRMVRELYGPERAAKILGALELDYGKPYTYFLPAELAGDLPAVPTTTYSEDFNCSDSDSITCDLTWTEAVGDIDIVTNIARAGALAVAYASGAPLSSGDMSIECNPCTIATTSIRQTGLLARFLAAQNNEYGFSFFDRATPDTTYQMHIRILGIFSVLQNTVSGSAPGDDEKLRFDLNGSTLQGFANDSAVNSAVTDTTFGNIPDWGIWGNPNGSQRSRWDNMTAYDIVSGRNRAHTE